MRYRRLILIVFCLGLGLAWEPPVLAQNADSLRLKALADTAAARFNARKLSEARKLADSLRVEAEALNYTHFMIMAYGRLGNIYHFSNDDKDRPYTRKALALAEETENYQWVVMMADQMASIHFSFSEYDSAAMLYEKAMETAKVHAPDRYLVGLANMGFIYGLLDNRDKELEYFMLVLEEAEANPEHPKAGAAKGMAYGAMGDYYVWSEEFGKALESFEAKLALGKELNNMRTQYEAHVGLGSVFAHHNNYDYEKAKFHFDILAAELDPYLRHYKYTGVIRLARLNVKEGNFSEALSQFLQAYEFYKGGVSTDFQSRVETEIGSIYFRIEQFKEARTWLEKGLQSARVNNIISREQLALEQLYKLDSAQGRYKSALARFQRYTQISDSLSNERSRNRISELQIQYETEQTERENLALKSDLELKEAEVQAQKTRQAFILVVTLGILIFAWYLYRSYKNKKRDNELISRQAEELKQLSSFKEGLTSMVVHDMKNPINSIIGFSLGEPSAKKMSKINRSGHDVLNLVTNMLDIQRFEEADVVLHKETLDFRELVIDACQQVTLLLQAKSLKVENEVPKGLELAVDKDLISRVLINLLTNAIKYSKLGETITISTSPGEGGAVDVIVQDRGEGIEADRLPYIFNKFWQTEFRKSGVAASTGLGLSFCTLAVEAHDGTIRAVSEVGMGTQMIFSLPANELVYPESALPSEALSKGEEARDFLPDLELLKGFLPALLQHKVHEVSAINKLIKDIERSSTDMRWSNNLQVAVYQGDQEKYDELLELIK